jgi:hypothetical protein
MGHIPAGCMRSFMIAYSGRLRVRRFRCPLMSTVTYSPSPAEGGAQMKRLTAAALCGLAMLAFAPSAAAAIFLDTARLPRDMTVSVDRPITTSFNVKTSFASISSVCLDFTFENDLLDPGDLLLVRFIDQGREIDAGGFFNPTTSPQGARTFCYMPEFQPTIVAFFLDGRERVKLVMETGSVMLASVQLTIGGVPQ